MQSRGNGTCTASHQSPPLIVSTIIAEQVFEARMLVCVLCVRASYLWRAVNMHNAWMGLGRVDDSTNRGDHSRDAIRSGVCLAEELRADAFVSVFFCVFSAIQMRILYTSTIAH